MAIEPQEMLYLPMRRRFLSEYVITPEGHRELRLFFGLKEIRLEESDLFSFGERLIEQERFTAGSATGWSEGAPYTWERVQGLLEALLAEDILSREAAKPAPESDFHQRVLEAEAQREAPTEPLWWNPDCPRVLERLVGRPLELGFLESMLPVHRLAHPALDAEGRHVGELNVFPDAMRMRLPTEWKTCPYPGSRYRDETWMNVTALRSMTRHWKAVLRGTLAVREAFLRHHPLLPDGRWRLGDLHAVSCAVLALPTLLLMRANAPVANGALEPVLSSLFRVTDGVRMVTAYLLFLPETPMTYDTPMTAAELLRLTEHGNHFLSTRGVCAGPPHLVEEFLATLMDGKPLAGEPPAPAEWDADIPAAMDYGLRGLQLYCLQFNLWSHMCRTYEEIRTALLGLEDAPGGVWSRLRARVERDWEIIQPTRLHQATQRDWAEARYTEMFDRAQPGVRGFREDTRAHLRDAFTPTGDEVDERARARLRELIPLAAVADAVAEFLALERSVLRALDRVQRQVNALLQRPHPARKFSNADLALHHRLRLGTIGVLPYLLDVLWDELGITVENTEDATRITSAPPHAQSS